MSIDRLENKTMNRSSRFEILLSIPWGTRPDQILPAFEDYPPFSELSAEQIRKVRGPLRIRLDSQHGIHVLPEFPAQQPTAKTNNIYHFGQSGELQGSTPVEIEAADYFHIHDYAVDAPGDCYLLERIGRRTPDQTENRLIKIARGGTRLWRRAGEVSDREIDFHSLRGTYTQILVDEGRRLYLPATEPSCAIAQIDTQSGEILAISNCEKLGTKTFLREGKIYSTVYFPAENRRALARFDVDRGQTEFTLCDADLFGWLIYPLGVDRSANFYVFRRPMIGQIDFSGRLVRKLPLDNLFVQPATGSIFVSYSSADLEDQPVIKVEIHKPDGGIEYRQISLPSRLAEIKDWSLVHVDEMDRWLIFGGEEPGRAGTLLILSPAGILERELSPPGDLLSIESRLEPFTYWQVDAEGRIYLPVTDMHGFKVIRLSLADERKNSGCSTQERQA